MSVLRRVDLGPAVFIPLPSIVLKGWYDMGLCYQFWPGCPLSGGEHVCMSARAIPHQCVCVHEDLEEVK